MRAAVFSGPGQFAMAEVPEPTCPAGGLLLQIAACAVCGSDVRIVAHGHHKITPPQVLGHELVGWIVESEAPDYPVGGRVVVAPALGCGQCRFCRAGHTNRCLDLRTIGYQFPGAFAERMAVPAAAVDQGHVNLVPEHLPDGLAALCEPLACCLNGQELVRLGAGDIVLIVGCGPIGCLHALLAKERGADRVLLLEMRQDRRNRASELELGIALDPRGDPTAQIRALTDDTGVDVALVAAPSTQAQAACLQWLAPGGRASLFGGLPPDDRMVTFDANRIHYPELMVAGAHGSTAAQNKTALDLLAGPLRAAAEPLITARYHPERTPEAVAHAARGEGLKTVVMA